MNEIPASLFRRGALLLALSLLPGSPLTGEPVAVPGGPESIRRLLELGDRRPERDFFPDVNRALLTGAGRREPWDKSDRRLAVALFADDLAAWRAEQGCPALLSARGEAWKKTRSALAWLGYEVSGDGPGFTAEPRNGPDAERRRAFLDVLGQPADETLRRLAAGEDVPVACADGVAELPFGLAAWREVLGADAKELNAGNAFLRFVKDVRASKMLDGLLALDPRTREEARTLAGPAGGYGGWFLLFDEALDGFTRFPEALVLRDGRVRLPGGPEADAAWEDVVGAPPSDKAEFVVRLFTKSSGKPAYVVDALRQLPEPAARAFVLGRTGGGKASVERFHRLYGAVERAGGNFERELRDPYDFAHVVRFLKLGGDGEIVVPGGSALWLEALSGSRFPRDEAELSSLLADAAGRKAAPEEFLERLFRREVEGANRDVPAQKRFLLVSSLVGVRPVLADPGTIVLLFRGLERLLPSCAPLEDLPLDDPADVRRLLFTLNRLDSTGTARPAELRAGLFEASLELLAALCRSGSLRDERARALVVSLLDLPLFSAEKTEPAAGIEAFEQWLDKGLVASLREEEKASLAARRRGGPARDEEEDVPAPAPTSDDLVAAALAGWRAPVTFPFRGGLYSYDPTADGAARRRAFAATQQCVGLSGLEDAAAARAAALASARAADVPAMCASVDALLEQLGAARRAGRGDDERVVAVASDARTASFELRTAAKGDAAARFGKALGRLDALRAERTLEALALHVYSSSAVDPADLAYSDPRFVRRHGLSWGRPMAGLVESPFGVTRLERLDGGEGSRVAGSFSGLADALGLLHAEQLVYDPRASASNQHVRAGVIGAVAYVTPARLDDDALRFVALACRAAEQFAAAAAERPGLARLDAWSAVAGDLVPPPRLDSLARAGAGEVDQYLSPSDLYRIGHRLALGSGEPVEPAAREAREAWGRLVARLGRAGASQRLAEFGPRPLAWAGRNRLVDMDLPSYERLSEYRGPVLFAERLYDVKVSAARAALDSGDPAALLPLLLEAALDDLLRGARMSSAFDWRPLTRTSEALTREGRERVLEKALEDGRITRAEAGPTS